MTSTQTLTDRAMLVTVSIKQWSATQSDKKINREVADNHGNDPSMGNYRKSLLAKKALADIKRIAGEARSAHYFRTLPWSDDGYRILQSSGYFAYNSELTRLQREFEDAVQRFLAEYPAYQDEARRLLNGLYDPADYPTVRELEGKFGFTIAIRPMPTAEDFRVQLGSGETARIRADIERDVQQTIHAAMGDVWTRVHNVVSHAVDRLKVYSVDSTGKTSNPFRDSLVSNITDLLDILPSLNLTSDPNLDAIARDIREQVLTYQVSGYDIPVTATVLRDDSTVRDAIANKAEDILRKMEAFF